MKINNMCSLNDMRPKLTINVVYNQIDAITENILRRKLESALSGQSFDDVNYGKITLAKCCKEDFRIIITALAAEINNDNSYNATAIYQCLKIFLDSLKNILNDEPQLRLDIKRTLIESVDVSNISDDMKNVLNLVSVGDEFNDTKQYSNNCGLEIESKVIIKKREGDESIVDLIVVEKLETNKIPTFECYSNAIAEMAMHSLGVVNSMKNNLQEKKSLSEEEFALFSKKTFGRDNV